MDAELLKPIGNRIRKLRKAQGLSQGALAELSNISYKYLGALERGEGNSGILSLSKRAGRLSLKLSDIVAIKRLSEKKEDAVREEILGLLAGKKLEQLKRALKVLKAVFN